MKILSQQDLLLEIIKELTQKIKHRHPTSKPWKDLSGHEWYERCLLEDWEREMNLKTGHTETREWI